MAVVAATKITKFWLDDPKALFESANFIPTENNTNAYYNSLTRLLLVVLIFMYLAKYTGREIGFAALIGIILIVVLHQSAINSTETFSPHLGIRDPCGNCGLDSTNSAINARYELTPLLQFNSDNASKRSYMNAKYEVHPEYVPSPYSEAWRIDSSDITPYTMVPDSYTIDSESVKEELPQSQTNYITRSSIDNVAGIEHDGGLVSVKSGVESAFQRDSAFYRDTIMGEYADYFNSKRNYGQVGNGFPAGKQTF